METKAFITSERLEWNRIRNRFDSFIFTTDQRDMMMLISAAEIMTEQSVRKCDCKRNETPARTVTNKIQLKLGWRIISNNNVVSMNGACEEAIK